MILTFRDLPNVFVFLSKDTKRPVGKVIDCIINPKTGIFEAFWVKTFEGMKLLPTKDILRWKGKELLIEDLQNLVFPDKLIRYQDLLEEEIPVLKAAVWDNKVSMGKVHNFSFDTISPRLLHVYAKKGWIFPKHYIIHSSRIKKIDTKGIHIINPPQKESKKEKDEKEKTSRKVASIRQSSGE